jgi:DNase/tRNase domain of colicin-like bacteriocin
VQAVSKPRFGTIDLYNVEVEYFHNYYVGQPGGSAVLVHNGVECIKTPAQVRETLGGRLPQEGSNGSWVKGEPGDGVWRSTDLSVREAVAARNGGAVPEHVDITFRDGYPVFNEHIETIFGVRGSTQINLETDATVSLRTRTDRDFSAANKWLAAELNKAGVEAPGGGKWTVTQVKEYLREEGIQWHHYEDMATMQLLRRDLHDNIPHIGGTSLNWSFAKIVWR